MAPASRDPDDGAHSRAAHVGQLLEELEQRRGEATAGRYDALAVLLTDSTLATDEDALIAAQAGLQRLYAKQLAISRPTAEQSEQRGRVLSLLEVVTWSLRRMTPAAVLAQLEPGGYNARFLAAVRDHPGLCNGQLAELLDVDETEISRVGRRLLNGGLAHRRRLGRRNHWELTPRGRQALEQTGSAVHAPPEVVAEASPPQIAAARH